MSNPSITADKTPWYQWDTGLTVTVSGGEMNECHFANRKQGTAYVQAVINGVARVPDELLQVAAPIKAYGYVSDGAGGKTYIEETFEVTERNIPADYTYTKTAQKTIRDAEAARDQAVQAAKDAKASELAADDSAVEASNSAQSAGESASAAATSESNAAKSASDAAKSASDANAAAGKAVEDASALLKTYTDNAKTSADNAATSASNAADAASAASDSASAAAQSATDASDAKVAAQTAKAEAATSASNAATSASNAASSATDAAKSASDAAASVDAINVIAPKTVYTTAIAEGYKAVAIGDEASAGGQGGVGCGYKSTASGFESVAIGDSATSGGNSAVAIGLTATANDMGSVAIGSRSVTSKIDELSIGAPATETGAEYKREITHVSTPTADTSASTKKYTDDNDAKTLSEAKKYTDANTSNALVGTVSGKLLHVEDAWPGKPLSLTIDGAYKQEGTPSPDNPVPIVVVENPVLCISGKNMVRSYVVNNQTNQYAPVLFADAGICESKHFQISFISDSVGNKLYTNGNIFNYLEFTVGNTNRINVSTVGGISKFNATQYTNGKGWLLFKNTSDNQSPLKISDMQIEYGETATDYSPYVGASLPITLPAEHPYLAALPDGTHDEIVIDKDGNVSLVARVQKVDVSNLPAPSASDALDNGLTRYQYWSVIDTPAMTDTAIVAPAFKSVIDFAFPQQGMYASNVSIIVGASADPTEALRAGGYIYTTLATPITYSLGKLDIPSLPETISNVWTDAELTTNMSMTYKRDINIAFENIVQAVVAAAAGE